MKYINIIYSLETKCNDNFIEFRRWCEIDSQNGNRKERVRHFDVKAKLPQEISKIKQMSENIMRYELRIHSHIMNTGFSEVR